ncbi:MAG: lipopolysaccharide heptosyltransferase I [Acidobacteria bacterium]|nr:MAG: lipopolysaccharide heptosyltransferase I [Acidobacteriota bacterium]
MTLIATGVANPSLADMKILIVKLSSIGDVIHTLPALAALRRRFPEARISWIVERSSASLLRDHPYLDDLIEIDTRLWRRRWSSPSTWRQMRSALTALRAHRFDVGLDFQGLLKSGLVLFLSGARRRIGFETACLREKPSALFLTEQVPVSDEVHVIEKNLALVRALGAEPGADYEFPLAISEEDRHVVAHRLQSLAVESFAIVNPGGNWKGKRWAPENYAAICDYLWAEHGLVSVITHAPGEEALAEEVSRRARGSAIPFACTLKQLAVLADRARLFIGGDTGPLHLAAARRTPIVAIFGPTPAGRNGPFSPHDIVVQDPRARVSPYYRRRRNEGSYIRVPVEEVKRAIERRLSNVGNPPYSTYAPTITERAN